MSDDKVKAEAYVPGLNPAWREEFKNEEQNNVVIPGNQPIPFDYPEGFNAVANSLKFLPEEARVYTLSGLVLAILMQ
jgi:hypothetical protein